MFCANCGAHVIEGASFCTQCGKPIAAVAHEAVDAQSTQPAQQGAPVEPQATQSASAQQQGAGSVGAVPMNQPTLRGCFGSGWDDVRNSPDWLKKVALMALIDLVPVLNWVSIGYGWNWAKDLTMGKREDLPGKIVDGDNFKLGFYLFVLGLVAALVLGVEGAILGFIPILGALAAIVLGVLAGMFLLLSFIRVAMRDRLGAGFEVGVLFDAYKRNLGTLFCISVVPGLIAAGVAFVVSFVFSLLIGTVAGTDYLAIMAASARYGSYGHVPASFAHGAGGSIVVAVLLAIVMLYLMMAVYQFCMLVTQRATGHYIVRFVPEWTPDAEAARQAVTATMPHADPSALSAQFVRDAQPSGGRTGVPSAVSFASASVAESARSAVSGASSAAAPVQAQPSSYGEAAAPVSASAPDATAQVRGAASSDAIEEVESYGFAETSVLPEVPEEDLDTVVQPELRAENAQETIAASDASDTAGFRQAAKPTVASAQEAPAVAGDGAVRLQPTVTSGPLVGDNPDTMVLMGEPAASAAPATSPAGHRTIRLTRANGDTCVLSSFPVTVGKGSEADLVIDGNGAISRVHVRILRDGDVFAAEDLGSTNKTFIGSYQLPPYTPTILSDGDELKLANEMLQVRIL